jgi:hypothetical protein
MGPEFMNSLLLLGIAAFNAFTAFMAWHTLQSAKRAEVNIQTVEKATNSMKDALVAAASKAGFQQGVDSVKPAGSTPVEHTKPPKV